MCTMVKDSVAKQAVADGSMTCQVSVSRKNPKVGHRELAKSQNLVRADKTSRLAELG